MALDPLLPAQDLRVVTLRVDDMQYHQAALRAMLIGIVVAVVVSNLERSLTKLARPVCCPGFRIEEQVHFRTSNSSGVDLGLPCHALR